MAEFNAKHSLLGSLEGGTFTDPLVPAGVSSKRASTTRGKGLPQTLRTKGAFYLYEQMMANRQGSSFYRLTTSASINKNISKRQRIVKRELHTGHVPRKCAFRQYKCNIRTQENVALFMNAYWYQYQFLDRSNVLMCRSESRGTSAVQPLKGKKSTIARACIMTTIAIIGTMKETSLPMNICSI